MNFLFGADPELFVKKDGAFVSGFGLIPGDKVNPHPVNDGAVQVDGMALEFNINPVDNEDEFLFNLDSVMNQLRAMVPDYELVANPVAEFTKEYIDAQPEKAKELGCDPDFNAWTGEENPVPNRDAPFRTGSGHIHIGWTQDAEGEHHKQVAQAMVRQMDFYLGLPSLLFDPDTKRRELYGKAGAHRVKPYGVEYRVLSNKWLSDKSLMSWAFRAAKKAATDLSEGINRSRQFGDIQEIINTSNIAAATKIIEAAALEVPDVR